MKLSDDNAMRCDDLVLLAPSENPHIRLNRDLLRSTDTRGEKPRDLIFPQIFYFVFSGRNWSIILMGFEIAAATFAV